MGVTWLPVASYQARYIKEFHSPLVLDQLLQIQIWGRHDEDHSVIPGLCRASCLLEDWFQFACSWCFECS